MLNTWTDGALAISIFPRRGRIPMSSYSRILLSAAVAALLPVAAHANLISNGTFAAPSCASPSFCTYSAGATNITGWTVTGNSVDLITGYWQAPPGGGNS